MSNLIDLNNIKESCSHCQATGIITQKNSKIGTICSHCRGKGYITFKEDYIIKITKQTSSPTNNRYKILSKWNLLKSIYLFEELQKITGIDYIAFANAGLSGTTDQWYINTNTSGELITYEDYLKGFFPLPDEQVLCPKDFTDFPLDNNNDCQLTCTKEQRNKCWKMFYNNNNTLEDKQKIIATKVKSLSPRKSKF